LAGVWIAAFSAASDGRKTVIHRCMEKGCHPEDIDSFRPSAGNTVMNLSKSGMDVATGVFKLV